MHTPYSADTNDSMCAFIMNSSERDGVLRMTLWRKSEKGTSKRETVVCSETKEEY